MKQKAFVLKTIYWAFIIFLSIGFISCKSAKNNSTGKNQEKKKESVTSTEIKSLPADSNYYRFTVSFFSKSHGIDHKMKEKYDKFISDYEQKNNKKLSYEITSWGREGEKDYCFKLSELTANEQEQFINDSKTLFKESSLVNVEENIKCRYKK